VTTAGATGFFGWQVWESDRGGFVGLRVKNNGLIGRFKEGSDPIFSGYGAFLAIFGFRLHDRIANVATRVGKHKRVRWNAPPRTAGRANDFDF
jgi:hypothetical protein